MCAWRTLGRKQRAAIEQCRLPGDDALHPLLAAVILSANTLAACLARTGTLQWALNLRARACPATAPQSAVPLDGSQSLLVFEGALRVHGFFDFLLNESFRAHGDECDVPTLLAPAQFAHASLAAVQHKVGVRASVAPRRGLGMLPWARGALGRGRTHARAHACSVRCHLPAASQGIPRPRLPHCSVCAPVPSACSGPRLLLTAHSCAPLQVVGASDARDPARAQHRLELRGAALPAWVLDRLAGILAVTQDGNFSMACDTHPQTLALNWCPSGGEPAPEAGGGRHGSRRQPLGMQAVQAGGPAARQLSDFEARQRGCWDSEEAARWCAAVPGLRCNVVRELRCEGGMFVGKLSAKSAERVLL